jgi:hypothetical protein
LGRLPCSSLAEAVVGDGLVTGHNLQLNKNPHNISKLFRNLIKAPRFSAPGLTQDRIIFVFRTSSVEDNHDSGVQHNVSEASVNIKVEDDNSNWRMFLNRFLFINFLSIKPEL